MRKTKIHLTEEQRKIIIAEYAQSTNSAELAAHLGMSIRMLYAAANSLGIKKSGEARSAISTRCRRS